MERSEASVISTHFIMCLVFSGLLGAGKACSSRANCWRQPCDKVTFDINVYECCVEPFTQSMANSDYQLRCPWPLTRRYYVNLTLCLENVANHTCCTDFSYRHYLLLEIHKVYFYMCTHMHDPDIPILLLLIMPCVIIPFIIPFLCQLFELYKYKLPNNN